VIFFSLFAVAVFAVRTWYRNAQGMETTDEELPNAEKRDLISLVHVARYASEQNAALEQERAARRDTESALQQSQSLVERTMSERLRLGRVLHDDACQVLYGVTLHLDALRTALQGRAPELQAGVERSLEQLRALNRKIRTYVDQLEARPLPQSTWKSLIQEATAPFRGLPGIAIEAKAPNGEDSLAPEFAEDVVHIVREAVANAVRHGRAQSVCVTASIVSGAPELRISDDGIGFDPSATPRGHGLGNMQERARRSGAEFAVDSAPGRGTTLIATWKTPQAAG
jgi:signal transduction histidine kinase